MKYWIFSFVITLILFESFAQVQNINYWNVLTDVGYETKPSEENGFQVDAPKFGKRVSALNGKKISLKGYLIPLAELGGKNQYMLSSLPFNSCYFCGGAGPETVVELQTKQNIPFTTKAIVMEGILLLNDNDIDHHIYILKDSRVIE